MLVEFNLDISKSAKKWIKDKLKLILQWFRKSIDYDFTEEFGDKNIKYKIIFWIYLFSLKNN